MGKNEKPGKFKMKMRKINRGVVLGTIIVVVWLIYLIISHFRFVNSTQTIKDDAQKFMEEFFLAAESDVDGVWSKDDSDKQIEEIQKVCDAYWTTKTMGENEMVDMTVKKGSFVEMNTEFYKRDNYAGNVSDTSIQITSPKVKQYGRNGAKYTATVKVKMTVPAYQSFPALSEYDGSVSGMVGVYEADEKGFNNNNDSLLTIHDASVDVVFEYDVTFVYIYDDGEWKISGCEAWTMNSTVNSEYGEKEYTINDGQTQENGEDKADNKTGEDDKDLADKAIKE